MDLVDLVDLVVVVLPLETRCRFLLPVPAISLVFVDVQASFRQASGCMVVLTIHGSHARQQGRLAEIE